MINKLNTYPSENYKIFILIFYLLLMFETNRNYIGGINHNKQLKELYIFFPNLKILILIFIL